MKQTENKIKVWCEECEGTSPLTGYENCEVCKNKGYTEHVGTLEDLKLAQAVKWAVDSKIMCDDFPFNMVDFDFMISNYRRHLNRQKQKDGKNEDSPSE